MSVTMPKPRDELFGLVIGRTGISSFKIRQEGKAPFGSSAGFRLGFGLPAKSFS